MGLPAGTSLRTRSEAWSLQWLLDGLIHILRELGSRRQTRTHRER